VIEKGLAQHVERVLSEFDYPRIYLNSPGGDLGEAVAVGRLIRRFGRDTAIGVLRDGDISAQSPYTPSPDVGGICESACAYLFMGGVRRDLYEIPRFGSIDEAQFSKIGFHRFYSQNSTLTSEDAQIAAGLLIEYLVEMGVDARLFLAASQIGESKMYYLTEEDALHYDIIEPAGFGSLTMEPYSGGVIAFSRRLDLPVQIRPNDHTAQITFFCEEGQPTILLTSKWRGVSQQLSSTEPRIGSYQSPTSFNSPSSFVSVREDSEYTYIKVKFPAAWRGRLYEQVSLGSFYINLFAGNAAGGDFGASLLLNELDAEMIRSSFEICIK
jgi:hypothetical protein